MQHVNPGNIPISETRVAETIIDAVPSAIIMVDTLGTIRLANVQAERLFGYRHGELLGEMIEILVPFRFRGPHPNLRGSFIAQPTARPMGAGRDLFGLRKDGSEFPIEIGLNPVQTPQGSFIVSAIVDISERKRLEARIRATVEHAPTAVLMIDQAGSIVLVNAELERLFGYDRDTLIGQKVEVLIPTRFRGHHPGLRSQYYAQPEARRMGAGRDLFGLRRDGSEFPIEIGLNPVQTDEGRFVLSAIVDISERAQTVALRKAVEALERSNMELQRFAHVASHDLQTPMRSIASFAGLLRDTYSGQLDARADDWLRRVFESTRQLQTLVRDLLEYSRVDSEGARFERVSMAEVFDYAVSLLDALVRETGAVIRCEPLPEVTGDRSQLVQLMLNLLGNGLKYRGDAVPELQVSAVRGRGEWVFSVRDNGIGIDARHHERIFEIFQRLHGVREYPGTGIGLAVCRRVVHRHGGRIWVESEPGKGSRFFFSIPESEVEVA